MTAAKVSIPIVNRVFAALAPPIDVGNGSASVGVDWYRAASARARLRCRSACADAAANEGQSAMAGTRETCRGNRILTICRFPVFAKRNAEILRYGCPVALVAGNTLSH